MKTYPRNPVTDPYEAYATLSRAAQELLELCAKHNTTLVSARHCRVQLGVEETWGGVEDYFPYLVLEKFKDDPGGEFSQLRRLGRLMELLINWADGYAEEAPTLFPARNGYKVVVPEDRNSLSRVTVAFLGAEWLLGRGIDRTFLDHSGLPSALGMAVREELENGIKAEETLSALLA